MRNGGRSMAARITQQMSARKDRGGGQSHRAVQAKVEVKDEKGIDDGQGWSELELGKIRKKEEDEDEEEEEAPFIPIPGRAHPNSDSRPGVSSSAAPLLSYSELWDGDGL
ncbi:uncharacterized protein CIMG_13711 [Coccidioides immitis RS]|uniref:Uncharacterized protein n=1 Tax=Coccidioides immitis (strain RS) TaxID=246410 RepID=A0A0D8JVZ0_COCIM|nr:uncharacterized protein CIMG_13711 [Coccidioides immitis RS]KJF61495.1 hypothetical protein CIMG_13711 [Coccidioides immitis RS]